VEGKTTESEYECGSDKGHEAMEEARPHMIPRPYISRGVQILTVPVKHLEERKERKPGLQICIVVTVGSVEVLRRAGRDGERKQEVAHTGEGESKGWAATIGRVLIHLRCSTTPVGSLKALFET
jgi:hypothetical protein